MMYKEAAIDIPVTPETAYTDLIKSMCIAFKDLAPTKGTKVTITINGIEMAQVLYNTLGEYRLISSRYRYSTAPLVSKTIAHLSLYFSRLILDMACMSGVVHKGIMPNMIAYMDLSPTKAFAIATHTAERFNTVCAMEYLLVVLGHLNELHANTDQLH